jgi:hypothetical protein
LDQEQFGLFEALTGWRMKAKPKNGLVKHQTIQTSNLAKIDGASSARSTYSKFEQEISDGNVQMKSENSWKESEHSFAGGNCSSSHWVCLADQLCSSCYSCPRG